MGIIIGGGGGTIFPVEDFLYKGEHPKLGVSQRRLEFLDLASSLILTCGLE